MLLHLLKYILLHTNCNNYLKIITVTKSISCLLSVHERTNYKKQYITINVVKFRNNGISCNISKDESNDYNYDYNFSTFFLRIHYWFNLNYCNSGRIYKRHLQIVTNMSSGNDHRDIRYIVQINYKKDNYIKNIKIVYIESDIHWYYYHYKVKKGCKLYQYEIDRNCINKVENDMTSYGNFDYYNMNKIKELCCVKKSIIETCNNSWYYRHMIPKFNLFKINNIEIQKKENFPYLVNTKKLKIYKNTDFRYTDYQHDKGVFYYKK